MSFIMVTYYLLFLLLFLIIYIFFLNVIKVHPILICIFLVFYTILICLLINFIKNNFWYSYILFLVVVGGVIILFIYFTRILSNEKFLYLLNYLYIDVIIFLIYLVFLILLINFNFNFENQEYFLDFYKLSNQNYFIKNLYITMYIEINIFLIIYLLFIIICAVLICFKYLIPIRKLN